MNRMFPRPSFSDALGQCGARVTMGLVMLGLAAGAQAQTFNGSASGIQGQVNLTGPLVTIPPTPLVTLPPGGGTAQDTLANLNAANAALGTLPSSGTVTVRTSSDTDSAGTAIPLNTAIFSRANVENLNLGGGALPSLAGGTALSVSCQSGPGGLTGQMQATDLTVLGIPA